MDSRLKVAIFSGGRGTSTICEAFCRHPKIELSVLVNAYDDGLSTGMLRRFIPGMLGPSDVRKNISRLMLGSDSTVQSLRTLLEYRLPVSFSQSDGEKLIAELVNGSPNVADPVVRENINRLSLNQFAQLVEYLRVFRSYYQQKGGRVSAEELFTFADCSVGNILFSGCFLCADKDFNRAIADFAAFCGVPNIVLNVTQGENLVLVGLKSDGTFLKNESEIVSKQSDSILSEVFLLADYLPEAELAELSRFDAREKTAWLRKRSVAPEINPEVAAILEAADIIIYGPGTQHSSLLPSYLTNGVAECIAGNETAEKIFISNIRKDFEIQSETANTLAEKLIWYLNLKDQLEYDTTDLVTRYFFQVDEEANLSSSDYVSFFAGDFKPGIEKVVGINWDTGSGAHLGGKVLDELIAVANIKAGEKLEPFPYMVSIVVPALNEQRTVKKVLHDLVLLDFGGLELSKEVLFVDGGSTDRTYEEAQSEKEVRCFQPEGMKGRGDCLRFGASRARGNVIVFFPSDDEYDSKDIIPLVKAVISNEYGAAFGSRAVKCIDLSDRIRAIYRGNYFGYLVSKYGGFSMSVLGLFLYNRFFSDPLTSLKVFDSRLLKALNLSAHGVDLEAEIISKLGLRGEYVIELPVNYRPRHKIEGKKTTVLDGLKALWMLLRNRFARTKMETIKEKYYEKVVSCNTGL
ncbi:MAG: 2-phospho-L-lactate transferase CofD family protein [Bdellovibrionota bacterium]